MSSNTITEVAKQAKKVSIKLASLDTETKNTILQKISENVANSKERIQEANIQDQSAAKAMMKEGDLTESLFKRLVLDDGKIAQLGTYLEGVSALPEPVGEKQFGMRLAEDLDLFRVSCPIGVVAVIFESRPEVVIQVSALALKSGNVVILKGGREATFTNRILFQLIHEVLVEYKLEGAVNLIETRDDVSALMKEDQYIDLIIPRGSNEFVRYIQDNSRIPVLGHSSGICHIYIDQKAKKEMAIEVSVDAKVNYPAACNATETILIHQTVAEDMIPDLFQALAKEGVEIRGDEQSKAIATKAGIEIKAATEEDWKEEYSDLIISVKVVDAIETAIEHINQYGSHHTDSIITEDEKTADVFNSFIDSACVFHNASTRFSDGFVFGLGAEVGISTNKTHARGPVGLEGLIIYKYFLKGKGQTKGFFAEGSGNHFLHQPI
ncbi:MAG: glutamate-5-semialdehyde dehydrogenase [bacterium]|jgi:glutamate-5-semialdehyde dehydrogenase